MGTSSATRKFMLALYMFILCRIFENTLRSSIKCATLSRLHLVVHSNMKVPNPVFSLDI
jgi:hypothetical protein